MSKIGNHVVGLQSHVAYEHGYQAYLSGEGSRLWINRAMIFFPDAPEAAMEAYNLGWQDASTKEGPQP